MKFTEQQIKDVLVALILGQGIKTSYQNNNNDSGANNTNLLSLEAALDWLCLHLPSKDLPKLFTDVNHLQDDNESTNLSVIKANQINDKDESVKIVERENETKDLKHAGNHNEYQNDHNYFLNVAEKSLKKKDEEGDENNKMKDDKQVEDTAKRAWLLSQYQYEDDNDDGDDENNNGEHPKCNQGDKSLHSNSNSDNQEEKLEEERPKFPEEIRLHSLEEEIRQQREEVNDEASNYMRSKYEIAEMKKKLNKLEKQAKGLRGKVAKKLALLNSSKIENNTHSTPAEEKDNDEGEGYGINLFDTHISTTQEVEASVNVIEYINVDIPSDWSGKTPKVILLEHCRKNKWTKPTFTRMENTTNGCIVKVQQFRQETVIIAEEGPFRSLVDAENFVSTKALYTLNPKLPLYLLLPPAFRDLWTSWLKEKEAKHHEALMESKSKKRGKIESLISFLSAATKSKIANSGSSDKKDHLTDEVLDDWDDESQGSKNNDEMTKTRLTDKIPKHTAQSSSIISEKLRNAMIAKQKGEQYNRMYLMRQMLPIFDYRQQILDTVRKNSVTVLCAETGETKFYSQWIILAITNVLFF